MDGQAPLRGMPPAKAIFEIPSRPPPTLLHEDHWPKELADFVAACLTKDYAQRPTAKVSSLLCVCVCVFVC